MHRIRLATCALLLAATAAHAGIDNAGTTAGNFLSVGTGAAILSMGGATLGGGSDLNAAAWNPAALGALVNSQLSLSHATLASQSAQDWLGAGGRFGRGQTRWAVTALYQGDGSFDGRDAFGASTGSFNVSSMGLGLQLAHPLGELFAAGLGVRWLSDNLGDATGHGLGLDAGVQAHAGRFGFGAAARNVGGKMTYASGSFDLPSVYGVGAAWSDPRTGLRFGLDANFPHAYYEDVRVGAEWRWQDHVALRAGYRKELSAPGGEPLTGPSFGLGAGANGVWMDYAFLAGSADAQGQHRVGLTFRPGFLNMGLHADAAPQAASAPQAVASVSAPVAPAPVAPAPAPQPALVVIVPQLEPPPGASESSAAPRASSPLAALAPSSSVRVPHLVRIAASTPHVVPAPAPAPVAVATPVPANVDAPAAPAPAPIATVASETPRVVVVKQAAPAKVAAPAKAAPAAPAARPATVTVADGETLYSIAKRWNTSVPALMMENNMVRDEVAAGQKLRLPPPDKR